MDLKEIDISTKNWVDSAPDRDYWRALVNAALKLVMELVNKLLPELTFLYCYIGMVRACSQNGVR